MKQKRWIVEMTIDGSVRPVEVMAENREDAKDKAEAKHPYPKATRTWNAYTMAEWAEILKAHEERKANARNRDR